MYFLKFATIGLPIGRAFYRLPIVIWILSFPRSPKLGRQWRKAVNVLSATVIGPRRFFDLLWVTYELVYVAPGARLASFYHHSAACREYYTIPCVFKSKWFVSLFLVSCVVSTYHLSPSLCLDALLINAFPFDIMSGSNQLLPPPSMSDLLTPGIVSIFVQGLETGLVLSQISQWLYLERKDGPAITMLVLFVTTVGLSGFAFLFSDSFSH